MKPITQADDWIFIIFTALFLFIVAKACLADECPSVDCSCYECESIGLEGCPHHINGKSFCAGVKDEPNKLIINGNKVLKERKITMLYPKEWQVIDRTTDRLELPHGWLVRTALGTIICYVPDKNKEWLLEEN